MGRVGLHTTTSAVAGALWLCAVAAAAPPAGRAGSCAGIASADQRVCCPASCGVCGGPDCLSSPGGACCTDKLLGSAPPCGPKDTGPCVLPVPIPAGKKRCTPALEHDLHYEACEPSCAVTAATPGKMPASCAQCQCKACPSCVPPRPPPPAPDYYTRFTTEPDALGCSFEVRKGEQHIASENLDRHARARTLARSLARSGLIGQTGS
jgi:hypothetical protein